MSAGKPSWKAGDPNVSGTTWASPAAALATPGGDVTTTSVRNLVVDQFEQRVWQDPETGDTLPYNLFIPRGNDGADYRIRPIGTVAGPQMVNIAVDDEGLVVDAMPDIDYVFVTPSHQSPTTRTLSLERRRWLLRKAELHDFVIIEDDYEAENLYAGAPMPALKSLDTSGRVIYIGSLSKSLSPALRLGYIVAPRELIAELRVLRHAQVRHPSAFLQHAYAMFLSLGHHESHARRVNAIVQERLARAADALQRHLPDFRFTPPQGGASLWVEGPDWLDSAELADVARGHGVLIEAGRVFYDQPPYPCPQFRMRLSSISGAQIDAGVRALALAVQELAAARGIRRSGAGLMH